VFSSELFMTADLGIVVQLCNCFLCSVLNCVRLLTRVLPYIFEDPDWRGFFWSTLPGQSQDEASVQSMPLAQSLITAICVRYIYCFKETENLLSYIWILFFCIVWSACSMVSSERRTIMVMYYKRKAFCNPHHLLHISFFT
jgi:hypothetical protein